MKCLVLSKNQSYNGATHKRIFMANLQSQKNNFSVSAMLARKCLLAGPLDVRNTWELFLSSGKVQMV